MLQRLIFLLAVLIVVALSAVLLAGMGAFGGRDGGGEVNPSPRPAAIVEARTAARGDAAESLGVTDSRQILFGDLHVHTTISADAFLLSLPLTQGEGAHPPADACDFARYCSALDFWSINDHAEGITPRQWDETIASIRQCNDVTSEENPDTVAFLGWEWTQVGARPEEHWGHKNVVVAGLGDDEIPTRPIASVGRAGAALAGPGVLQRGALALAVGGRRMHDFARFLAERSSNVPCPTGVHVKELPADCMESAATPGELFQKLDEWGFDSMVIPHGTSWGFYTPPGSSWRKQLTATQHDPERQSLIEVFSGHGNSEEYRDWRAVEFDADGVPHCPEPRPDYVPSCWRAGEIIRERCRAESVEEAECDSRAAETRQLAAEMGVAIHHVVSGEDPDDWLDAGQCRDCVLPSFNHRPGGSVQYIMAIRNFEAEAEPDRFRFGFMASSDNHFARPGTGYKEFSRRGMTESRDVTGGARRIFDGGDEAKLSHPIRIDPLDGTRQAFELVELERQASFFMTGGLIATHSTGRDRQSIWDSMQRKEVYGTSGPRILLYFDAIDANGRRHPMGSSMRATTSPRFEVRAVGSFEQKPGCPEDVGQALSPEELQRICKGECYHPSEIRRPITRVEIVRIRPQRDPEEDVADLIDDPWLVLGCSGDPAGCRVAFEDATLAESERDALYYVRAIEAPSQSINAGNLRCQLDAAGNCTSVQRCGTAATKNDDCLSEAEERAWSSPIFIDWAG